jgi:hypothetical protein
VRHSSTNKEWSGEEWSGKGEGSSREQKAGPTHTANANANAHSSLPLLLLRVQKLGQNFPVLLHNTECKARSAVTLPVSRIFFSTARQWFTRSLHKTQLRVAILSCRVKALGRGGFTRNKGPHTRQKDLLQKSFTEHKRPTSIFFFFFFFPCDAQLIPGGYPQEKLKTECFE